MQNLINSNQTDRNNYLKNVTVEGSRQYAFLYASGMAPQNPDEPVSVTNPPKGFPAEDFNNFATVVYLAKDNRAECEEKRAKGEKIIHIDAGTGTNIDNLIAGLAVADEAVAIDLAPANLQVLEGYKEDLPSYWNDWLDVARIMYDLGSPEALLALDKDVVIEGLDTADGQWLAPDADGAVNLYDSLRKWSVLSAENKALIREKIYAEAGVSEMQDNPYAAIQEQGLQNVLKKKLTVRQGDNFNPLGDEVVPPVNDLAGKAHLVTQKFVTESNSRKLGEVLHAENNIVQFCRPDGFRVSAYMAGTEGYGGFITAEQLAEDPDIELEECPMARSVLKLVTDEIVEQDPRYLGLTAGAAEMKEERKMVRPGKQYSEAVIVAGRVNYQKADGTLKFQNGTDFLNHVRNRVVTLGRKLHATHHDPEATRFVVETADNDLRKLDNNGQLPHTAFNWDTLDDGFWERYAMRHYQQPQKTDLEHLLSVITDIKSGAQQEDSTFVSVRTASAPQYALAAMAGGMENIVVSHQGQPGIDWLQKNLLSDNPEPLAAGRVQMWWEIAKLLSTFKSKDEFNHYCGKSGFDTALNTWQYLSPNEKKVWFNRRLAAVEENGVTDHFLKLDDNGQVMFDDVRSKIRDMADKGKFQVRKFSPMDVPADLKGKADVVECSYITDSITQVPSERLDCVREVCSLAKKGTGRVSLAETAYTNWDVYEPGQSLPGLKLPLSYLSVTAKVCAEGRPREDNKGDLHLLEASTVTQDHFRRRAGMNRNLSEPLDTRFDYFEYVSLRPQDDLSARSGTEMLAALHQEILNETKCYLFEHPDSINLDPEAFKRDLDALEESLGMERSSDAGFIASGKMGARQALAQRIDQMKEYLSSRADDPAFMNRVADGALSQFLEASHDNLVNRERGTQRMETHAHTPAGRVGYTGVIR